MSACIAYLVLLAPIASDHVHSDMEVQKKIKSNVNVQTCLTIITVYSITYADWDFRLL
jgi:hypothetical protein